MALDCMAVPSADYQKVNAPASGGSPRKADVIRPIFPQNAREIAQDHAATIIAAAFPGPSENAICDLAASRLGCDPSTIRGILRKETKRPDFTLIFVAMHFVPNLYDLPAMRRFIVEVLAR
jgi:hypothetical protein